jgi:hypothetical protein
MTRSWFPVKQGSFFTTVLGVRPPFHQMGTGSFCPVVKRMNHEVYHFASFSIEVRHTWSYIFTSQHLNIFSMQLLTCTNSWVILETILYAQISNLQHNFYDHGFLAYLPYEENKNGLIISSCCLCVSVYLCMYLPYQFWMLEPIFMKIVCISWRLNPSQRRAS